MIALGIDFNLVWMHMLHLGIAFILALPIAINREYMTHNAGLRTFPLVAIASCAFMLVGLQAFPESTEARARVMYGVITGMGFIGGGAIIKDHRRVGGTATAAGMWNTAAIGIAVAFKIYEIAIVLAIVGFGIFQFFKPLKHQKGSMTKDSETE